MAETYDFESVTVAGTAIGFTTGKLAPSNSNLPSRAVCTLETAQVRYRLEGTPTASVGHLLEVGETLIISSLKDLKAFKAIRTGSVSGVLKVSYERGVI